MYLATRKVPNRGTICDGVKVLPRQILLFFSFSSLPHLNPLFFIYDNPHCHLWGGVTACLLVSSGHTCMFYHQLSHSITLPLAGVLVSLLIFSHGSVKHPKAWDCLSACLPVCVLLKNVREEGKSKITLHVKQSASHPVSDHDAFRLVEGAERREFGLSRPVLWLSHCSMGNTWCTLRSC